MKICFWGDVASALKGNTPGGSELQISLYAKLLSSYGHEVTVVDYTISEGFTTPEGVKVVPVKGWNSGLRFIRTFTHRFPNLYKCLKEQKADIYYCRVRDFRHILAYHAARKVNAKFILALADGLDTMNLKGRFKNEYFTDIGGLWWLLNIILSEIIHPYLLRKSDLVFAQHEDQRKSLQKKGIQSSILPNLIETKDIPKVTQVVRPDFVYVGSLAKNKGLVDLFKIIEKTPLSTYKIIGQPRDKTGFTYIEKFKEMKNVVLLGRLDHKSTLLQIGNSRALISTSALEGFPNIFLEAWACGVPVISLYVNPGNILVNENIGHFADGNIEKMLQLISDFKFDDTLPNRAKNYVYQNHIVNEKKTEEIGEIFNSIGNL